MNARKPAGYPSMSPYLICKHAERLIGFLKDAFGGVLLRRFDRPDGSLMHAEAGIDDGVVMIAGTHKLVLALFGPRAMSDLSPECAPKRAPAIYGFTP